MAKIVQRSVHVQDPESGQEAWLHPGDKVPDWATGLILNPSVFSEQTESDGPLAPAGEIDYSQLTVAQLDELLFERGLEFRGTKPEKAAFLKEQDAAHG